MNQTRKEFTHQSSTLSNPTAHLRKSGIDFPLSFDKDPPRVKNNKVNA